MPMLSIRARIAWTLTGTLCFQVGCEGHRGFGDAGFDSAQDVADAPDVLDAPDERADVPLASDADADADAPDGGPPALRLIAPPSTSIVTSRRPRLRWSQTFSTRPQIELCADRACTRVLETLTGLGSVRPTMDLPPGVVFWRVRRLSDGVPFGEPSATWQFTVPHRSAVADSASGSVLDVNGDGLADFSSRLPSDGLEAPVQLFLGRADGDITAPDVVLPGPGIRTDAGDVATGDVNGDGFGDLIISDYFPFRHRGAVRVYFGGPGGISPTPDVTLAPLEEHQTEYFGYEIATGDVDGDGFTDVLASCSAHLPTYWSTFRAIAVFKGGPGGPSSAPSAFVAVPERSGVVRDVVLAGSGDVNGDGYADAVLMSRLPDGLYLFRGGPSGLAPIAEPIDLPPGEGIGARPRFVGDVNGDGYSDLAIPLAGDSGAQVRILYGGVPGFGALPSSIIPWPVDSTHQLRTLVEPAGDVNGDGFDDVLFGAPEALRDGVQMGAAFIHFGGPDGLSATPGLSLFGDQLDGGFGCGVAGGGRDLNGDGFADFLVGACNQPSSAPVEERGTVYLYFGGDGVVPSAVRTVRRPAGEHAGPWGKNLALRARHPFDRWAALPFGLRLLQPAGALRRVPYDAPWTI
jgi:hypothetical protein